MINKVIKIKKKNIILYFLIFLSTFFLFQNVYREFYGQFKGKKYDTESSDFHSFPFYKKIETIHSRLGKNPIEIKEEINSTYAKNLLLIAPLAISIAKGNPYFYIAYGFSSFLTFEFTEVLKLNINRERPDKLNKKSFPSGHASMSFLGTLGIYELLGANIGSLAVVPLVYVCVSRVFAKRHHITDILGGMLAALVCFHFSMFLYRKARRNNPLELKNLK